MIYITLSFRLTCYLYLVSEIEYYCKPFADLVSDFRTLGALYLWKYLLEAVTVPLHIDDHVVISVYLLMISIVIIPVR
jgi:hypothetical protein